MYAPGRWDTSDGCVPFRLVWAYFATLGMGSARTALDTARGIGLAFGGDDSAVAADRAIAEAFPTIAL